MTSSEIKAAAQRFGADLVGIAATDGLAYLPKEENPLSIFPQARNVIVIARKIPRGTLRGIEQGTELDNSFHQFGLYHLEDQFLARTSYDLTIWMEAQGFEAVPLFAYDDATPGVGVPVADDKPAPNVMLKYRILAQAKFDETEWETWLNFCAISGGALEVSGDLRTLSAERLTRMARTLELSDPARIVRCPGLGTCVNRPPPVWIAQGADQTLVGAFNWADEPAQLDVSAILALAEAGTVVDAWSGEALRLTAQVTLAPHASRLWLLKKS